MSVAVFVDHAGCPWNVRLIAKTQRWFRADGARPSRNDR
ncbi:hypothetical protein ALQ04_100721 [Pseudomonas cichorii]|uniref:Uncharacterized protein n=1 Tax=Pseudomonas cichorii TaxID=36746 RepID=A0A3M4M330_PSECI|nr:hypothetical protein ALQ04_100721 [Pseudomonas cichorii]